MGRAGHVPHAKQKGREGDGARRSRLAAFWGKYYPKTWGVSSKALRGPG